MATIEELHAQIAAAKQTLEEKQAQTARLREESGRAEERQRLRRQLEEVQKRISHQESINSGEHNYIRLLDIDALGQLPTEGNKVNLDAASSRYVPGSTGEVVNCSEVVSKGEYLWKIEGLSWLVNSLQQNETPYAESCCFIVGGEEFTLVYHPMAGEIGDAATLQKGSLAVVHQDDNGITFRWRAYIKRQDGEFVQWGQEGNECYPTESTLGRAFGPDVHDGDAQLDVVGIFGLSHEQLLKSEWVLADSLTVKFELEVRPNAELDPFSFKKPSVEVPGSSLGKNFLSFFDAGKYSDVSFSVQGQSIKAHSQILAARSDVFDRQFHSGMSESLSKEVVVEDCDAASFKAVLRFLYSDDLKDVEDWLKQVSASEGPTSSGSDRKAGASDVQISLLQNLLHISHKYEVQRLRLWCEQRLCECISVNEVFSVLCQAHLYDAKQLEQACLGFIKENLDSVVATPAFGRGTKEWPEVMLKVNIFIAGLSESKAARAVEAQQEVMQAGSSKKRKLSHE